MLGTKSFAVRALLAFASTGLLLAGVLAPTRLTGSARGQEKDKLPKGPETKVEAEPTPGQPPTAPFQPSPNDFPPPPPPGFVPVSGGGIFASPPADGYRAEFSTTGTIVNIPQIDFPGIVTVVPSSVIADQQAINVDDILRNIPSAIKGGFEQVFRPNDFILRGFEVNARDWRWNGYQDFSPAPRDFFNVTRYEILQGPASVLYGSGQPSGLVNVITKKPIDDSFAYGDVQAGSFGLIRTTADVNGAVDSRLFGGTWLVRLNFGYMNTESFRDFGHEDRVMVDPVFTYAWDSCSSITYEFQYLRDRRLFDSGVAALGGTPTTDPNLIANGFGIVGGNPMALPRNEFLGQPTDFQSFNDFKQSMTFVHDFGNDWAMRVGGFFGWHNSPNAGTPPVLFGNDPSLAPLGFLGVTLPNNVLLRQFQDNNKFEEQNYDIIANLAGKLDTFGITHHLLVGYEYDYFRSKDFSLLTSDVIDVDPLTFAVTLVSPIDAFNPTTGYTYMNPPTTGQLFADVTQSRNGFFAQDQVDLTSKLKVLAGVRADIVIEQFSQFATGSASTVDMIPNFATNEDSYFWSPRVGVVYQPIEKVMAIYGLYSTAFDPATSGIFAPGTTLRPETSQSWEGGIKLDLLDRKLSLTATGFWIDKQNVVTQFNQILSEQIGEQRSQGCELSAVGRLTDRWSIIANYAYVDSRIIQSAFPEQVGDRFRGVPFNNANLWTRYNVVQDCNRTLGAALGIVYVGNRPGDIIDSFSLGSYTRWDAGVYYQRGSLTASLYFENIFDRNYDTGSISNLEVFPGAPFTFRALVGWKF
jgi:iron complex outermembrane receptor protein